DRLIPGTIRSLWRNERPVVRSDGAFKRDYVYVRDAVDAYLALAEALDRPEIRGECFNFGPGEPRAVLEVVEQLRRLMGKIALEPDIRNEARDEIREQSLSASKARRLLGWTPRHAFEDGLKATIAWYERFLREAP
ncbi:MAG: NAD-dependent epimerase/dehydratase family protein, partial [bacterium]